MSSFDLFSVPSTDYQLQGYKMVPYHKLSASITPMKFSVQALEDYVDLNRSYFVIDLRLYSSATNGIVADANAASDGDDTRFVYAVNNLAHTIFNRPTPMPIRPFSKRCSITTATMGRRCCNRKAGSIS